MFTFVANPPNLANRGVHSYVNVAGSRLAGTVPDLLNDSVSMRSAGPPH